MVWTIVVLLSVLGLVGVASGIVIFIVLVDVLQGRLSVKEITVREQSMQMGD